MSDNQRIPDFVTFWPFYLGEHKHPLNRALHFAGSSLGLICLLFFLLTGAIVMIPLGLICGYGCAWVGHFFVERNKPASFTYPLWSFMADWKMWFYILTGKIQREMNQGSTK